MSEIMTVRGPVAPDALGFTSMHENVLFDASLFRGRFEPLPENPALPPDEKVRPDNLGQLKHGFHQIWDVLVVEGVELMAAELADFKIEGGSAVVDMSTPGMLAVGEATGVPLAVGLKLLHSGKISRHGVYVPEKAIDPDDFFNELAPLCTLSSPLESAAEMLYITES